MSTTDELTMPVVTLDEGAAAEIRRLMESESQPDAALRIFIAGSGCSGLQYGMALADEAEEGDTQYEQHGVRILVDSRSKPLLEGATVQYIDDETGKGFKIENPNQESGGGCGSGGCGGGCGCSE